ncbi:hypothetical protein [Acetobacter sp. DsW_059]|uniref:hypothetical protein n=1 Tax=Acetobacter sp. DsW_059 TaxID=1670661 RepID=UPI000A39A5DA|nr:hypothetical protein [Acetobacter sp. DsW_059]OUJ11551.1 hypothetical protein HK25_00480 [Acetobacter sp. DsW_059]
MEMIGTTDKVPVKTVIARKQPLMQKRRPASAHTPTRLPDSETACAKDAILFAECPHPLQPDRNHESCDPALTEAHTTQAA